MENLRENKSDSIKNNKRIRDENIQNDELLFCFYCNQETDKTCEMTYCDGRNCSKYMCLKCSIPSGQYLFPGTKYLCKDCAIICDSCKGAFDLEDECITIRCTCKK